MADPSIQQIVCVFGKPVAGNPTQFMMERAFAERDLDWRYLTLEVSSDDLEAAVRGMTAMGFRGCNLTIPHKVEVIKHLHELSQAAELMGAVNVVRNDHGKLIGDNTDGKGFVSAIRQIIDPAGKRVALLGAGGAARAIAVELALAGAAACTIVNRSSARGQELVKHLNERLKVPTDFVPWTMDFDIPQDCDLLVNATSIGLGDANARIPVNVATLRPGLVVADVIFNPPETLFIREARQRGCLVADGLGMLVQQAVIAFKIWTGVDAKADVMKEALEEFLEL